MNDEKWLWHKILGHVTWMLISKLNKLKLVRGLPELHHHSDVICGACQRGKIVKTIFKPKNILSPPPDLWNYFTLICLDQLEQHQSLGRKWTIHS